MSRESAGRSPQPMSRRQFLRRSAGAALAFPAVGAVLDSCTRPSPAKRGSQQVGVGGLKVPGSPYPLAREDAPVKWTIFDDNRPIPDGLPIEKNATLQIYEWAGVLWNKVLDEFQSEYSCKVEVTTYSSAVEGITKLASGKLAMDSFDIGPDMLGKLVAGEIIQPLNHSYIPNITKYWSEFQNPFYDQGWRYTLPSSVYQTGIGYRRDVIPDNKIWGMKNPYEIYWDPAYSGRVGIYDDYREAIGMVLLKNGITDVDTGDSSALATAQRDLTDLTKAANIQVDYSGAYRGLPQNDFVVHQAWSMDMTAAQHYLPKGVSPDVLGFWYPQGGGMIGNSIFVIPQNAPHPVLAHAFQNFWITHAFQNFKYSGSQPPLNSLQPETLVTRGYINRTLKADVVLPTQFDTGHFLLELSPDVDQAWHSVWAAFKSGA